MPNLPDLIGIFKEGGRYVAREWWEKPGGPLLLDPRNRISARLFQFRLANSSAHVRIRTSILFL